MSFSDRHGLQQEFNIHANEGLLPRRMEGFISLLFFFSLPIVNFKIPTVMFSPLLRRPPDRIDSICQSVLF
jgi:hypothetical protein